MANIIPIYKKESELRQITTDQYHSLLSVARFWNALYTFMHYILSYIPPPIQIHHILCEQQHGFQAGKSCDSQSILTINDFVNSLNENKHILLDFPKAFDGVPSHRRLFCKLYIPLWDWRLHAGVDTRL